MRTYIVGLVSTKDTSIDVYVEPHRVYEKQSLGLSQLDRSRFLTFCVFCITNFCIGVFYAILGPFFPQEVSATYCQYG